MPTEKEPFANLYDCPLVGKSVTVSGVVVSLDGQGQFPVALEPAATGCSGMPACGCIIGTEPCPYPG